jgi:deazaflavin-dependent oxidoreductase (nitroreductase family)
MQEAKSKRSKSPESNALGPSVKGHKLPFYVPMLNPLMKSFLHLGIPAGPMTLLTVCGRKTGKPHTTPVGLFKIGDHRYIFDTFGNADWVRNLRASGEAKIGRGLRRKHVIATPLGREDTSLVLREILAPYVTSRIKSSFLKMGYSLTKGSTMADYDREAKKHSGFELRDKE